MKGWKYFGSLMAPLSSATYPRNCLSLDFLLGEQSKLYLFKQIFIEYFIYLFIHFWFLGLHLWHMEDPRLGVRLELELLAAATVTATPDLQPT